MIKSILAKQFKSSRTFFCTRLDIFPDQIVDNLRSQIGKNSFEKVQNDIEVDVINNIHFFDSDQFTDIFVLFAQHDRGSAKLWELLSRKIYDHELNVDQRSHIFTALRYTNKHTGDIATSLGFNYLKSLARNDKQSLFEKVLY